MVTKNTRDCVLWSTIKNKSRKKAHKTSFAFFGGTRRNPTNRQTYIQRVVVRINVYKHTESLKEIGTFRHMLTTASTYSVVVLGVVVVVIVKARGSLKHKLR